ncbi:biopolymer transporter ExbD [Carboxylicivirga mesophila]|uniref:Biopolymer transporter ExbD n=1 Tax=Carboxylicivirga mesophila TaxID=1166478 RepID=A0ABS5K629_9BACT|nr:biopolymer transporter ExbD [Carboxylicivirga mesophila]MBS2210440.1 biopolymer transporter ExbD [Carboxylicivirga mesophila]
MSKREVQEVNAGSMADIAFLLLIFFLVTTTMDTDTGLARLLPPPVEEEPEDTPPIKERNVFTVLINSQNQLLVEGRPMEIRDLTEATKEFILNPLDDEKLPEKKEIEVELLGVQEVTKGVISLQNDRDTEYQTYLMVQNELQRAYNELRDDLAKRKFGKTYEELEKEEQKAVRSVFPQKISEAEPKNIGGN